MLLRFAENHSSLHIVVCSYRKSNLVKDACCWHHVDNCTRCDEMIYELICWIISLAAMITGRDNAPTHSAYWSCLSCPVTELISTVMYLKSRWNDGSLHCIASLRLRSFVLLEGLTVMSLSLWMTVTVTWCLCLWRIVGDQRRCRQPWQVRALFPGL